MQDQEGDKRVGVRSGIPERAGFEAACCHIDRGSCRSGARRRDEELGSYSRRAKAGLVHLGH